MKPSPTNPGVTVPALAKTDEAFVSLQEHDDEVVAAAARARLEVKSTLLETRIEKFIAAAHLAGGKLPIPLRYCGADTGRDSGEEYNPQNLPRIYKKTPKLSDCLRRSLRAPHGYVAFAADQSNIELRVNHFLWRVPLTMTLFQGNPKADPYRAAGAKLLRTTPDKITDQQRHIEKTKALGLGFGAGAKKFVTIAKQMGGLVISQEQSAAYVDSWRSENKEIVEGWARCAQAILNIADGAEKQIDDWGLLSTCKEGIVLPSGRLIRYPNLRREEDGKWDDGRPKHSWFYGDGRHRTRITGPKVTENCVQAMARDSICDAALEFFQQTGLRPALRVHDELVYVEKEDRAEAYLAILQQVMRTPPKWWPELVVWSDGNLGPTYADTK